MKLLVCYTLVACREAVSFVYICILDKRAECRVHLAVGANEGLQRDSPTVWHNFLFHRTMHSDPDLRSSSWK